LTVLSDGDILAAVDRGELAIEPLDGRRLTPNGYDLGIAEVALPDGGPTVTEGVAIVPAGSRFVVSTQERVRLGPGLAGQLWLRTTWARRGVLASFGRVDAGFDGTLTLAAHNAGARQLEVPVGQTFAQLVLEPLTSTAAATYEARSGNYQHQRGVTLAPRTPARGRRDARGDGARHRGSARGVRAPCLERGCHECCLGTEMPLTEDDMAALAALGHDPGAFATTSPDGRTTLANVDGRCHFLGPDGRCVVYERRPEGCTMYPLVMDGTSGAVVVDEVCPHGADVRPSRRDADRVRSLLARLERERARRARGGGGRRRP
jgi:dCTP deaminase